MEQQCIANLTISQSISNLYGSTKTFNTNKRNETKDINIRVEQI